MVGLLFWKYGRYQEDKPYKHYGLNYIEVKKSYREYGISKMLIDEMAKILDNDMPLSLSQETTMGKRCKMAEKFKNAKFKTHIYAYRELEETLYK